MYKYTSCGVSEYSLTLSTATILVSISLVIRTTQFKACVTYTHTHSANDDGTYVVTVQSQLPYIASRTVHVCK